MKKLPTLIFSMALLAALPAAAAERLLELRLEGAEAVQVHNLVGTARLLPGDGALIIRARVTADQQEVADGIQLSRNDGRNGVEVVVAYPDKISRIRYDGEEFRRLDATLDYHGRKMRVTSSGGERVRVDLEILVPADRVVELRQGIGEIRAAGVQANVALTSRYGAVQVTDGMGRLAANTGSGRIAVTGFRGDVKTNTGSGTARLENVLGRVEAKTGSGGVSLRGVDGDIVVQTGSGGVRLSDSVGALQARTGSGSIRIEELTAGPELNLSTGSGSISLAGDLGAVRDLVARTGSGSVRLESSTPLSLSVDLSTGSGSFRVDSPALSNVESGRRSFKAVIGAGEGTAKISTGSGSIRITAP